jgi:nitrite reductase/ring-hydroxylating ferredoxin subunit
MSGAIASRSIVPGQMTSIDVNGTTVAIANVNGKFFAISDVCPNAGCSLSHGSLEGMVVTCSKDGSQFDLASGHVVSGPAAVRVRTYHVQVYGDELRI